MWIIDANYQAQFMLINIQDLHHQHHHQQQQQQQHEQQQQHHHEQRRQSMSLCEMKQSARKD